MVGWWRRRESEPVWCGGPTRAVERSARGAAVERRAERPAAPLQAPFQAPLQAPLQGGIPARGETPGRRW